MVWCRSHVHAAMGGTRRDILVRMSTAKNLAKDMSKRKFRLKTKDSWSKYLKRKDSRNSHAYLKRHWSNSRLRMSTVVQCRKFSRWALFISSSKRILNSSTRWWWRWKRVECRCRPCKRSRTKFLSTSSAYKWLTRGISEVGRLKSRSYPKLRIVRSRSCSRRSWCKFNKASFSKLSVKV